MNIPSAEALLQQAQEDQEDMQRHQEFELQYEMRLRDLGVKAPEEDITQPRSEYMKQYTRFYTQLSSLATTKVIQESLAREGLAVSADNKTAWKKQIQASLIAEGFEDAWVQLVDEVFEGDGLSDDDVGLVAEQMITTEEKRTAVYAMMDNTYQAMREIVNDNLTSTEVFHMHAIARYAVRAQVLGTHSAKASGAENARLYLIEHNINDPRWKRLLTHFF